jgi:anti-sigma B factor antagonist
VNRPARTWGLEVFSELVTGGILLAPKGRIGSVTAGAFERAIQAALAAAPAVVIDLGGIDYISGAGIQVLEQASATNAARMILFGARDSVQITLELSGVAGRVRVAQSKEEALEALTR